MQAAVEAIKAATELQIALGGRGGMTSMDKSMQVLTASGLNPTVVPAGIEVIKDRYDNEWTYGHPDAPDLPDGRGKYAKKKGVSKAGKSYIGWFDPAMGPKPFTVGAVEGETICTKYSIRTLLQVVGVESPAGHALPEILPQHTSNQVVFRQAQ
jgi:hypothetical protein